MRCMSRCGFFFGIFFSIVHETLPHCKLQKGSKKVKGGRKVEQGFPIKSRGWFFFLLFFLCKTHRLLMESFTHLTPNQFFEDVKVEVSSLKFGEPLE